MRWTVTGLAPGTTGGTSVLTCARAGCAIPRAIARTTLSFIIIILSEPQRNLLTLPQGTISDRLLRRRQMKIIKRIFLAMAVAALAGNIELLGQAPEAKNWTTAEDHKNMMEQLGIKALRPGRSPNQDAPNRANYDESQANPFPDLPEVLK